MAYLEIDETPEPTPLPTREEAQVEIADWQRRVDALYRDVIDWLPKDAGYEVDLSWIIPVHELMLDALELPPYQVPMLQVRRSGERLLIFRPDARWVMFTRGRVKVGIGDGRWETLLAIESEDESGCVGWTFWDAHNWRRGGDPWNSDVLREILEGER
ncbi:hypothetical protein [Azospirillum sp.]|uniref:hypothetical protein n=1 Tax=Azospirillum sp. TaxID=34012 RepID=UPI0026098339|nr:hypothetical protein [Azospirillum sp.]